MTRSKRGNEYHILALMAAESNRCGDSRPADDESSADRSEVWWPSLRPAESHRAARRDLLDGDGWLVFHHFRKCAGTSLRAIFLASLARRTGVRPRFERPQRKVWRVGRSRFYQQEWGALMGAHLAYEPPVVLATCLRDPVARHVSEFYYAGPGSDPAVRSGSELQEAWLAWLRDGADAELRTVHRGRYIDNFFIRSLLGSPDVGVRVDPAIPYFGRYGVFGGGGPLYADPIGEAQLEDALRILASFDLVLLTERLHDPATLDALRAFLDDSKVEMVHDRRSEPYSGVSAEIAEILREHNAWDVELVRLVAERFPAVAAVHR